MGKDYSMEDAIIWPVWVLRSFTPIVGCDRLSVQILYMHGTYKENKLFSTYLTIASKIVVWPNIDHGRQRLGAIMHLLRIFAIWEEIKKFDSCGEVNQEADSLAFN